MTLPKVAIRVDGSTQIGSGHVLRCLALACTLRSAGAEVRFVLREHDVSFADRLERCGFAACLLPRPDPHDAPAGGQTPHGDWLGVSESADAVATLSALGSWHPDVMVVDHYGITATWHNRIRDALACRIVAVDDLADRPLAADLIVDHNPHVDHREKYAVCNTRNARVLGGPRFALIAQAFRDAEPYRWREEVRSIGIFLGGIDLDGASMVALASVRRAGFEGHVEVVSSRANPRCSELTAAVASDANASLSLDLPDLVEFFASHDLQIGAGGGASWERCRMGVPAIILKCATNQGVVTAALRAADAAVTLDDPHEEQLAQAICELLSNQGLRSRIAANAAKLVDGRGGERVALVLFGAALTLRPATVADSSMIHRWRNHPSVRAVSRNSREVPRDSHEAWLRGVLADSRRDLLIGQVGGMPVGVLRYDSLPTGEVEISLFLDPALQGLGLGGRLLHTGETWLAGHRPAVTAVVAEIIEGNAASRTMFERAGFSGSGNRVRKPTKSPGAPTELSIYP